MAKLTKRCVDGLHPGAKDYFVWDDDLKGFGVRVLTSGRRTFLAQYRSGGVQRRVKLGVYGAITADQARSAARQVLGDVAGGDNPAEDIKTYRMAPTVTSVCQRFFEEHAAVRCKRSTQYEYRRAIHQFIKPAFGSRKIADITRADVAKLHHEMRHIPYQANRVIGVLSKMFNLAEVSRHRAQRSSPIRSAAADSRYPHPNTASAPSLLLPNPHHELTSSSPSSRGQGHIISADRSFEPMSAIGWKPT